MASIRKHGAGWRAEVFKKGHREAKTFPNKAMAAAWATALEAEILAGTLAKYPAKTLDQAMTDYEVKVSSTKRGAAFEAKRFAHIRREHPALAAKVLHEITTGDLAEWRDKRLQSVTSGTVKREATILRHLWTIAGDEWKWCDNPGPWKGFRYPTDNLPRDRRIGWREIRRLLRFAGYRTGERPRTKGCEAAWAFLVGLRTAMRASEIIGLTLATVNLQSRVVRLDQHKTAAIVGTRHVPVTKQAGRLLGQLAGFAREDERQGLFTQTAARLDANWRKLLSHAAVEGLHFHDSRAEALTLMSRKVDVMTLARISGHRDLKVLMDTYYRERPEEIAARL